MYYENAEIAPKITVVLIKNIKYVIYMRRLLDINFTI
jgi:hypothetical protein